VAADRQADHFEIRVATSSDALAIAGVHFRSTEAAYRQLGAARYLDQITVDVRHEQWRRTFETLAYPEAVFVAHRSGSIVGFVHVSASRDADADPEVGELDRLYIDPGTWRTGVGSALNATGLAHLAAAGFTRATLWVLESNERARRFYEREGWNPTDVSRSAGRWVEFVNIRYERSLE
jgi:ribosomal protein S18 acetylase RimI-like enzyme